MENNQLELNHGPVVKRLIELWGIEKTYDYICEKGQNEWQFLFFEMLELKSYDWQSIFNPFSVVVAVIKSTMVSISISGCSCQFFEM